MYPAGHRANPIGDLCGAHRWICDSLFAPECEDDESLASVGLGQSLEDPCHVLTHADSIAQHVPALDAYDRCVIHARGLGSESSAGEQSPNTGDATAG